ncbi:MAG TPA: tryptophan--tRNA ligase [Bacteroidetes bacterium]|nr:tryptophan--tRNA ligase [Bacteroidota bacterium]HEX04462.1 tryptophan--tRNA ligase [Bacteroidota bacterium]
MTTTTNKKRILSGMRATGRLHLGNFVGALENWVKMQGEYENYHLVADWHVLTTDAEHTDQILPNTIEMVRDWLSAGIDPNISPMFRQSQVKEHAELHLLFSMLVTQSRLERNPTLKDQIRDLRDKLQARDIADKDRPDNEVTDSGLVTYGHLGYPVLQAADILLYKGNVVPVGEDQLPHVEITREIARRFNRYYGEVFPEPTGYVLKESKFSRLPGSDGKRMSKSLGNTIYLSDSEEETGKGIMSMVTDVQKVRRNDPGRPEVCNVFTYHQKFNPDEIPQIETDCKSGELGCVACKKNCAAKLNAYLAPMRERRQQYDDNAVMDILTAGEAKARAVAQDTMIQVRDAMNFG